jgi:hypothetical protein
MWYCNQPAIKMNDDFPLAYDSQSRSRHLVILAPYVVRAKSSGRSRHEPVHNFYVFFFISSCHFSSSRDAYYTGTHV